MLTKGIFSVFMCGLAITVEVVMNLVNDNDAFERCRRRLHIKAPSLLHTMEGVVAKHPLLSGDITFYASIERLLNHAPSEYARIIEHTSMIDIERIDPRSKDANRVRFFCFQSKRCLFPHGYLKREYTLIRARTRSARAKANPRFRAACEAATTFYLGLCSLIWIEFGTFNARAIKPPSAGFIEDLTT